MVIAATLSLAYLIKSLFDLRSRINGNWLYFMVIYLKLRLAKWKSKRLLNYNYKSTDMFETGSIANPTEHRLDRPQKDKAEDIFLYGVNSNGTALSLSIKWRPSPPQRKNAECQQVALVHDFMIRDKNGVTYTLKEKVDRTYELNQDVDGYGYKVYRGAGLQLQIESPMRRYRLKGRGYFRRSTDGKLVYLRLRFLWISTSCVLEYDHDQDPLFIAGELAASLKSIKDLLRIILFAPDGRAPFIMNEERFEQMGQFKGTLTVENEPQQELYLWGSRTKTRYGDQKPEIMQASQPIEFHAYTKAGTAVHVGIAHHATIKNLSYRFGGTFGGFGWMSPLTQTKVTEQDLKQLMASVSNNNVTTTLLGHEAKELISDNHVENGTAPHDKSIINNNTLEPGDKPYLNGTSLKCNGSASAAAAKPMVTNARCSFPTTLIVNDSYAAYHVEIKEVIDASAKLFRVVIQDNEGCGLIVNHQTDDDDEDDEIETDEELVNEEEVQVTGDEQTDTESQIQDLDRPIPRINQTALDCLPSRRKCETERHIPLVASLIEPCARLESITGGKGSSLALLRCLSANEVLAADPRFKFTVPYGVVVTTAAYKEMLRVNDNITKEIEQLERECNKLNQEEIKKRCDTIVELVANGQFPIQIREAIGKAIGSHSAVKRYAVRSSACGEDSEEMSAAGQMQTFLGVKGIDQVCESIMKCWASSFGQIAVEYKRGYGQPINSPMAVVVQEMVDCDAAGVMFTCNPVTGDEREVLITANYGLGESVVSASADPDTIILSVNVKDNDNGAKRPRKIEEIKEIKIGNKGTAIKLKGEDVSGTDDVVLDEALRSKTSITDEQARRLGQIGLIIQRFYNSGPRDIEWGIKGDKIYMLQSRPITTLDSGLTEFEILHEMDTGLPTEKEYLSRANVGEVLPGTLSYLTSSFIFKAWDALCWDLMAKMTGNTSLPFQPYNVKQCAIIKNYGFFNCKTSDFLKFEPDGSQTEFNKALTYSLFGHDIEDDEVRRDCGKFQGKETWLVRFRRWKFFLKHKIFVGSFFRQVEPKVLKRDWASKMEKLPTSRQMVQYLFDKMPENADTFEVHLIDTFVSSDFNNELLGQLTAAGGHGQDLYSDFATLLSTCKDVISAEVPRGLQALAASIPDGDREAFRNMSWQEAYNYMTQTGPKQSREAFASFMRKYGHRGYREFEPSMLPWRDNPKPLIESIQTVVLSKGVSYADHDKLNPDELMAKLRTPLPIWRKLLLKHYVLPRCWRAVGGREKTKNLLVYACDILRRAAWTVARKMVEEGLIPEAELFFCLTMEEVLDLIDHGRNMLLVRRAKQRRKVLQKTMNWTFDEIVKGYEFYSRQERESTLDMSKFYSNDSSGKKMIKMHGTPVSTGKFRGTLCVCPTLNDAKQIKPGDILVTYSTDIGWSPYFPMLGGIVTEIGGLVSHGAVIAREYGLPALVGVDGAVRVFKTGDQVILDCESGYIIKLEKDQ